MSTVTPIDEEAIVDAAKTGALLTVEEHSVRGGLGGAVAEVVSAQHPVPVHRMGFTGFLPTGSADWLLEKFGLTAAGIAASARALVARRR
jgi:transketolase